MPFCPECGKENPQEARFCQFCGQAFPETSGPAPSADQATPGPAGRPPLGNQPAAGPPPSMPQPAAGIGPPAQAQVKNPFLGGVLGFINFGLAAFYNGQTPKGIALLILTLVFGGPTWVFSPLLGLIFGGLFAYDGYKISQRINNGETVGPWQFF